MPLPCLQDPACITMDVQLVSCTPADGAWEVELSDTPFYPEGGGQPTDTGTLGDVPVVRVVSRGDRVIHVTAAPVPPGPVRALVDRARRWDHMQQHTGQHLLTAVTLQHLGLPTIAFHIQPDTCDIELDTATPPDLADLEQAVNAQIRAARPVRTRWVEPQEMAHLPVRSRGLPEGHTGPVRLVEIEGLDLNTCGGTHLGNTAEIQALKLLQAERLKRGVRLYWIAGQRVLRRLGACLDRERDLSRILTCGADTFVPMVARMQDSARDEARTRRLLLQELSGLLARDLARQPEPVLSLHREDADLPWLNALAGEVLKLSPDRLLLFTGPGVFLVAGPPDRVSVLGPRVAQVLCGRGGGARGRYQGKADRVDLLAQALQIALDG